MAGTKRDGDSRGDWAHICTVLSKDLRDQHHALSDAMAKLQAPDLGIRFRADEAARHALVTNHDQVQAKWANLKAECAASGYDIHDLEGNDPPMPTGPAPSGIAISEDDAPAAPSGPAAVWDTFKEMAAAAEASVAKALHDTAVAAVSSPTEAGGEGSNANGDAGARATKDGLSQLARTVLNNDPARSATSAMIAQGPLSGSHGSREIDQGEENIPSPMVRPTKAGSSNPGPNETLVGSSRDQMKRQAARIIAADSNHPLSFLLDGDGKFKSQGKMTDAELMDRPDLVNMGHIASNKLGGEERLMIQGAYENQYYNRNLESPHVGGAVGGQKVIDIGGVAVDYNTARFWDKFGMIPPGVFQSAPWVD